MPRFLVTILVIIGIYYGIRFLFRLVFPFLMRYWMNKMTGGQFNEFYKQEKTRQKTKTGDVTVEGKGKSRGNRPKEGDYVDFEEMK